MGLIQLLLGVGAVLLLLKLGDIKALSQGKIVFGGELALIIIFILAGSAAFIPADRDNIALAFAPFIVRSSWVRVMRHDQDPGKAGHREGQNEKLSMYVLSCTRDAQKSYKSDS
uniref:Uncharacterized protein n=1 Tax=Coccidioides posadasii RMSCC 3488 TaxID=454284 RepID=A0A0J6FJP0_COCPO|nr:hypothetical protein CPAG_05387 [Coccidioides posadasii RMSCC 3488]